MRSAGRCAIALLGLLFQLNGVAAEEKHPSSETVVGAPPPAAAKHMDSELPIAPVVLPKAMTDIRALYALQDLSAAGNREAVRLQKELLPEIGHKLTEDIQNYEPNLLAQSVAGFVLSGGDPLIAERLAERNGLSGRHRKLLEGSALFMRGKRQEARKVLDALDARSLQPTLVGRLALAQAIVSAGDRDRQQYLLAISIAAMPGSLVEESALRRSALAYAESGNQPRFWQRVFRYQRRFRESLYASDFLTASLENAVRFEDGTGRLDRQKADLFLGSIAHSKRLVLYLHLARMAVLGNHQDLLDFAASRLHRLAVPDGQEAQIAELYLTIFDVAAVESTPAAKRLQRLSPSLLPDLERSLLEAALAVVREIQRPAEVSEIYLPASNETELGELQALSEAALRSANDTIGEAAQ